jgi:hypothetical protein
MLTASQNGLQSFETAGGLQSQYADAMVTNGTRRYSLCCQAVTPALKMSVGLRLFAGLTGKIMLVHPLKI